MRDIARQERIARRPRDTHSENANATVSVLHEDGAWSGRGPGRAVGATYVRGKKKVKSAAFSNKGVIRGGLGVAMVVAGVVAWGAMAHAQQINGVPGSPSATINIDGRQLPPPPTSFGGVISERATESKPYWPPAVVPKKGAPNVLLIMTDDVGFGAPSTFGGVIPTPALDRIAKAGLRYTQFHSTALCSPDARRADHRTQPPHGRLRRHLRTRHGFPRLRLDHREDQRHGRRDPEAERLRDLVVRQEPQHAGVRREPGRTVRPVADRYGLRVLLRLHRRRLEPVAAESLPQHDGDLSVPGQVRLEPDDRDGGRRDPAHEAPERARAGQAVLRLLRAGRHACAASSHAGVDQEDQRHEAVRQRLECAARDDLREPEAARRDSRRIPS